MGEGRSATRTILQRVGAWAAGLTLDDIPPRVQQRVREQVASSIAAAAATSWHQPARAVLRARNRRGKAMVYATGQRRAPADAAFANAAFAMSLDWDDYMLTGHTGHSAVLVPLAFARELDDVVVAATAADELMGRLSTACLLGPLNGQMSSYIHNAGAALALGKVWGLSAEQLTAAVALALYQPSTCLAAGFWEAGAKTITACQPLEQGIRAAELARAGLTGPADLLEHPLGFLAVFSFGHFTGLFDAIGQVWFADTLCHKRYPGTSYISAAVEGALEASGGRPLQPAEIERVGVETTVLSATLDSLGAAAIERSPLDANAINFSLRLSVAAALRLGDLTPDSFRPQALAEVEDDIRAIARKVHVIHDWSQSLEMMAAAPVGLRLLTHLSADGAVRTVAHARRLGRASGRAGRNPSRLRGLARSLPPLLGEIVRARRQPVTDRDFDAQAFRMLQSARTTLRAGGTERSIWVEIPVGACGRDREETRRLIRWRCEQGLGQAGAERLLDAIARPGTAVDDLLT